MFLVLSRFKVANDMQEEVRAAFLARHRLVDVVPGFLGLEVFTDSEDSSVFHLVTRWTDLQSFREWHGSEAHHQSHRGIPKGLKLAPGFTEVTRLERLQDPSQQVDLQTLTADSAPTLAQFLSHSRSVHLLVAGLNGTIRLCNAALSQQLKMEAAAIATRRLWDMMPEADAESLRRRVEEGRVRSPDKFLLNFVDSDHCPFTLECTLEVQPGYFLLLGEVPGKSNEASQEEMLRLNNEMAVLSREHARQRRELERTLAELNASHWHLKKIQEVLPICMECGKVKSSSRWEDVLSYLKENALFLSHGYCPTCTEKLKAQWALPPRE
jgi:heme-degrading monooxygenase HmoA